MKTARLGEILKQKNPMEAVEQFARGDVHRGMRRLEHQGRVHEIVNPKNGSMQ